MEADRRWLALVPQADELRAKTKLKGKPTPEQIEELKGVKAELQQVEQELAAAERRRAELLDRVPAPPDPTAPDGFTDDDAVELRRVGEPPPFSFEPRDHLELGAHRHGARRQGVGLALRLPHRRRRAARARALPLRARPAQRGGLHARPPARARARGRRCTARASSRPTRSTSTASSATSSTSRARPRWPSPPCTAARSWTPSASAPLRGLLDLLPPRGRRRRQGHARHVPRPPVRQGRDVRLLPPRGLVGGARPPARDRGGARRRAGPPLPRRQHRRRRSRRLGREEVRHRGLVPEPGPLPRDHVDLEHDRLPVAPPRDPLPRRSRARVRPHAERHGGDRPRHARRARELPGRGRLRCRARGAVAFGAPARVEPGQ